MEADPLRAYLVDDEPLALERLTRLLAKSDSVQVAGQRDRSGGRRLSFSTAGQRDRCAVPRHSDAGNERV